MPKLGATMVSSAISMLFFLVAPAIEAKGKEPLERDKLLHGCVSAIATAGGIKMFQAIHPTHDISTQNRIATSMAVLLAGYAWELDDKLHSGKPFDKADFAANVIGVVVGNILQWEF